MSKKRQSKATTKTRRAGGGGTVEVPPVIIKGGSLNVLFRDVAFDSDADAQKKVTIATHPNPNIKIHRIEIHDNRAGQQDRLLCFYDANAVNGSIDIVVFAQ